jgi:hypothetical protein
MSEKVKAILSRATDVRLEKAGDYWLGAANSRKASEARTKARRAVRS